jgi:hypothetical protein
MSDTLSPLQHTVFFGRKMGLPNYSNQEASIFIQVDADRDLDAAAVADKLMAAFVQAKSQVLTQLGIAFELDAEGVIVESSVASVGPQSAAPSQKDGVTQVREAFPGATVEPNVVHVDFSQGDTRDPLKMDKREQKQWLIQRFSTHPHEFFDNRGNKRNPKGPDLKHKASALGVWLDNAS